MNYKGTRHDSMRQSYYFFLLATLCLHCCKMAFSSCSEGECGILEYEVKLALGSITMNKASGGD